ncbi:MAG TPA: glycosyltransferase family 4 protein [Vicinamibacterales bacterium]|nr:glycosyltransferase family 4 protein [Vicinamibacterales bacterium]
MRVAFLSVSDQLGGSEVALLQMIRGVRRERPSWTPLVVLPGRGPLLAEVERAGGEGIVLAMPAPLVRIGESAMMGARARLRARIGFGLRLAGVAGSLPRYLRQLTRLLRSRQPHLLHTNGLKAHVLGTRAAAGIPIVWHLHEYIRHRPITRRLLRRQARGCSLILTNSRSVADDVRSVVGEGVSIRVLHNAVDLGALDSSGPVADLDTLAGIAPGSPPPVRIGLVASFGRWKGHDVFLRALAMLPPHLPVRGYLIGSPLYDTAGSQRSPTELQELVRQIGLAGRVGLTGYVAAPEAMRALDVMVHASTQPEPFGLVIAEAMACGRAVVTSGLGGASELIVPGQDALTHEAGDAASLAAVLERLVRDPSLRAALGRRAQEAARARFDPGGFARSLVEAYEGIAGERSVRDRTHPARTAS